MNKTGIIKSALIIFAREPKEGKVKTRLAKDLSHRTVTELYKAFVRDVLNVAAQVKCDQRFIYYVGRAGAMPFLEKFAKRFSLKRQIGATLGDRLHQAFCACQKKSFNRIVVIGTDCVTLKEEDIEQAFKKLEFHDCVLGPSKDGGYYLMALRMADFNLFKDIPWSTSQVFEQTCQKIREAGKSIFLLRGQEDIDTIANLKQLSHTIDGSSIAIHTQNTLARISL